jgi:hypothetical protein
MREYALWGKQKTRNIKNDEDAVRIVWVLQRFLDADSDDDTTRLCRNTAGVASERRTSVLGLDRAEALELLRAHTNTVAEANLAGSTAEESDTVGVQRLVD